MSLAETHPELAKQWHPTKNGELTPNGFTPGSHKKVWWKCEEDEDHEWEASVKSRSNGNGCPCCRGFKVVKSNCLATTQPELAKEWHPTKNGKLTPFDVIAGTYKKVWWKCDKADDHEWESSVDNRYRGSGCPCCIGQKVILSNCLETTYPQIAKEWHPTKNGKLTPFDFTPKSGKKMWWKCNEAVDHEWETRIANRSNGDSCPYCRGLKATTSNCLATLQPKLAKEWHPTKNGKLTPYEVVEYSNKKVWWKCDKADDHEWEVQISNRTQGRGCPYCTLTPQSKQELIITFELKTIFKDINPKGYKTKIKGKIKAIDIFIPLIKLVIEFDGSYWHKDKLAIDKIKSELLIDEGYKVIRIREEPLKKIHENDIISPHPYNGKQITDNILKRILDLFVLDSKTISRIKNYLEKDNLQNEKGLDKYIDQILREKANN